MEGEGREELFVGCLTSQQHASISQTITVASNDLLKLLEVLAHCYRSCRSNFLSHPVAVY